jgi:hypothetical protein
MRVSMQGRRLAEDSPGKVIEVVAPGLMILVEVIDVPDVGDVWCSVR